MSRSQAREQALQILFLIDMSGTDSARALSLFEANFESNPEDLPFARQLVEGVVSRKTEIDAMIEKHSKNWRVGRMGKIDRNILRMATFELIACPEIPKAVSMDEAIELGKRFGDTQTSTFVNGILDPMAREIRHGE